MGLLRIADDLEGHEWYIELVSRTIAEVEAFLRRWAEFEDSVAEFEA